MDGFVSVNVVECVFLFWSIGMNVVCDIWISEESEHGIFRSFDSVDVQNNKEYFHS